MKRSIRCLATLAAVFAAVQAQAITIDFTGIVSDSGSVVIAAPAVGETITGTFSFDEHAPASLLHTDGATYLQRGMRDYAGGPPRLGVSGHATFSGGASLTLASDYGGADTLLSVMHDDGGLNEFEAFAETYAFGDASFNSLILGVYDFLGAATTLFPSSSTGLSFGHYVYSPSAGLAAHGSFGGAAGDGFFWGSFVPTSFTITESATAVPEPGALALMLAGLAVVAATTRRRASRRARA